MRELADKESEARGTEKVSEEELRSDYGYIRAKARVELERA